MLKNTSLVVASATVLLLAESAQAGMSVAASVESTGLALGLGLGLSVAALLVSRFKK